jgi:hypothetical protein
MKRNRRTRDSWMRAVPERLLRRRLRPEHVFEALENYLARGFDDRQRPYCVSSVQ